MIISYCSDCNERLEFKKDSEFKCSNCGHVFFSSYSTSNFINMRTTWSGQTKMEFNTTSMSDSINKMKNG